MMRLGYYASASPAAVGATWVILAHDLTPIPVALACGGLVMCSATWPGLVAARYRGRMNPAASLVRGTARAGYVLRTHKDRDRTDLDRGPTYCLEWCALAGLAVALVTLLIPPLASWAWWWGGAVAVGCAVHVLADLPSPTGVPLSALYNVIRHREVWRRHSLGWYATDSGGDVFWAFPLLFALSGVLLLGMVGWLGAVVTALTGWSS